MESDNDDLIEDIYGGANPRVGLISALKSQWKSKWDKQFYIKQITVNFSSGLCLESDNSGYSLRASFVFT